MSKILGFSAIRDDEGGEICKSITYVEIICS